MEDNNITKYTLESILLHFSNIIHWLIRVIIIEAVLILLIVAGFLWYVSLPVEEYTSTQTMEDISNSELHQSIGE